MAKRLHELSPRAQLIVFAGLSALAIGGAWQGLIGPMRTGIEGSELRLSEVEAEVQKARLVAMKLPRAQQDVNDLETALREMQAVIPEEKDPQDVLRHLHELASESAVDIATFKPRAIVAKAQYTEWPIELGLEGGYHDLGRFFDRIASVPRLMSVVNLQIRTKTRPNARGTISASCVATTYVFQKDELSGALP